ncbi:hypothetical protein NPIL_184711 [Nephila pilipes]|uniref:Uncharacterized protein n=1 Tax=Nephila pilipes TaxID=299642 RepID=A0A8X6P7M3_NEPPI|nr:hypothetical protein NPIL_184711 [Nephila pilipes]
MHHCLHSRAKTSPLPWDAQMNHIGKAWIQALLEKIPVDQYVRGKSTGANKTRCSEVGKIPLKKIVWKNLACKNNYQTENDYTTHKACLSGEHLCRGHVNKIKGKGILPLLVFGVSVYAMSSSMLHSLKQLGRDNLTPGAAVDGFASPPSSRTDSRSN